MAYLSAPLQSSSVVACEHSVTHCRLKLQGDSCMRFARFIPETCSLTDAFYEERDVIARYFETGRSTMRSSALTDCSRASTARLRIVRTAGAADSPSPSRMA